MAEPLRSRLRPARRSGLTSPDPVRNPHARQGTPPQAPRPGTPDKPQNRQRQGKHALKAPAERTAHPKSVGGLRLSQSIGITQAVGPGSNRVTGFLIINSLTAPAEHCIQNATSG